MRINIMQKLIVTKSTDIEKLEERNMNIFLDYLAYLIKKYKDVLIEKPKEDSSWIEKEKDVPSM